MRPSKLKTAMDIAYTVSLRSHDAETKVGSVLVNNHSGAIIATGCNGFVRNAPDKDLPTTRPDKYAVIVHSEVNLIANCAYNGISTKDCTVICTLSPCISCMRLLYQCGITTVVCKEKYKDYNTITQMKDIKVVESVTPEGYFELKYEVFE
jgi:dCMP deaminase